MQPGEIAFLMLAVAAISLFGGVLAWASWMEWRGKRARPKQTEVSMQPGAAATRRSF